VIAVHVSGEKTAGEGMRVFGDLAMVEDFVERSGGHIKINRQVDDRCARRDIFARGMIETNGAVFNGYPNNSYPDARAAR